MIGNSPVQTVLNTICTGDFNTVLATRYHAPTQNSIANLNDNTYNNSVTVEEPLRR